MKSCEKKVAPDRPQTTIWRQLFASSMIEVRDTHTQNMQYLLLYHVNNVCKNAPQC
jgi:hypothetical protein